MKLNFLLLLISIFLLFSCQTMDQNRPEIVNAPSAIGSKENPSARYDFELMQTVDPVTGQLPSQIHYKELQFAKKLPGKSAANLRTMSEDWKLAGPYNVGGRTRALALDIRDEKIILAGGASGGIWRTTNGGKNWARTSNPSVINGVTCVAQDTRVGMEDIWYYGTGELNGNSARIDNTPYRGDGIFKSIDGGVTWDILSSTSKGKYSAFDSPFNYIWALKVDPINGDLYAAIYGGIVKSTDQGESWTTVLGVDLINENAPDLNFFSAPYYTNIMITPTGKKYATLSTFSGNDQSTGLETHINENRGVFISENGIEWENINAPTFSNRYYRMVMDYAPSDEGLLYLLSINNSITNLWKYEQLKWSDLSNNVPGVSDTLAAFDVQGGYNLIVKIHPLDPKIVFVGATNLYRSTDGFATNRNTTQIGGYDIEKTSNIYEGHHPDQHELIFIPSNQNQMLSANDGGVRKTTNNKAVKVEWTPLNNGYVTSQFYTVALSKVEGSNETVGGLQDNGTYIRTIEGENVYWSRLLGGDGSYCATTPNDRHYYTSFQSGTTFRMNFDRNKKLTAFAEVDPVDGSGYLFINPFVLDPNNYNRMYMAGGNVLWRNDNLSQIPNGKQLPTSINWQQLNATKRQSQNISALDVSTIPPNVVYYGTAQGEIVRIDNASSVKPKVTRIFAQSGYVSNVAIDPSNADQMMFSYGNYNLYSLFYTNDGGQNFVKIAGNLEENDDGSGNGPSIRWNEIVPLQDGSYKYFTGTSVGLFSSVKLDGELTVWEQEGVQSIGNSVIRMTDYRSSDGRFVVATHGNGVFENTVKNTLEMKTNMDVPEGIQVLSGYPTPFSEKFKLKFTIPNDGQVVVSIINSAGQLIRVILNASEYKGEVNVSWDGRDNYDNVLRNGMYFYQIQYGNQAKSGKIILAQL